MADQKRAADFNRIMVGDPAPLPEGRLPTTLDLIRAMLHLRNLRGKLADCMSVRRGLGAKIIAEYAPLKVPVFPNRSIDKIIKRHWDWYKRMVSQWPSCQRKQRREFKEHGSKLFPVLKCKCFPNQKSCSCQYQIKQDVFDYMKRQEGEISSADKEWLEKRKLEIEVITINDDNDGAPARRGQPDSLPAPPDFEQRVRKKRQTKPPVEINDCDPEEDEGDEGEQVEAPDPDYQPPIDVKTIDLKTLPKTSKILESCGISKKDASLLVNTIIKELKENQRNLNVSTKPRRSAAAAAVASFAAINDEQKEEDPNYDSEVEKVCKKIAAKRLRKSKKAKPKPKTPAAKKPAPAGKKPASAAKQPAPGQANGVPGQANAVPGQVNAVPGQANAVPRQANIVPGQANIVPGQAYRALAQTSPNQVATMMNISQVSIEQVGPLHYQSNPPRTQASVNPSASVPMGMGTIMNIPERAAHSQVSEHPFENLYIPSDDGTFILASNQDPSGSGYNYPIISVMNSGTYPNQYHH